MTVLVPGATEPQPPQDWGVSCQPDHSRQIRASRYGVTVLRLFSRCKSPVLTHLGRCPPGKPIPCVPIAFRRTIYSGVSCPASPSCRAQLSCRPDLAVSAPAVPEATRAPLAARAGAAGQRPGAGGAVANL